MKRIPDGAQVNDPDDLGFTDADTRNWERQSRTVSNLDPPPQAEIDEILAAIDDSPDPHFLPDDRFQPIVPRWMEDFKVFQARHGPFTMAERIRIFQELNKSE